MTQVCRFTIVLLTTCLVGCDDLPYVPEGICGNGVVEAKANPAEECDGWAPLGARCRPPESKEGACRYDCAVPVDPRTGIQTGTAPRCPDDAMSCGLDGICRTGTGTYEAWGSPLALRAHSLNLVDFDGDGVSDLFTLGDPDAAWQAEPQIVFLDEEGERERQFALQALVTAPDWLELPRLSATQFPRQAAVVGTSYGIATLSANSAQDVYSTPYPFQILPPATSYRLVRIGGTAEPQTHDQVFLYMSWEDSGTLLAVTSDTEAGRLTRSVEQLSGDPIAGNIDDTPCDEIILAFRGERDVFAHGVCDASGVVKESSDFPHVVATLPFGHTAEKSPILARIDGNDTHLDLLVSDQNGSPYVAFGRGDGTFVADPLNPLVSASQLWPVIVQATCTSQQALFANRFPLAVGDLNRDTISDWVLSNGVALTQNVVVDSVNQRVLVDTCPGNWPSGKEWSIARIADLNNDGAPDLVAGSAILPGMDFYLGTGFDVMTKMPLPTEGPVQHLITGDYNGDLTADIAFVHEVDVDSAKPSGSSTVSLAIAFGSPNAFPDAPVNIAQFPGVDQLFSSHYLSRDAIEAIGVLSSQSSHTDAQLSLFFGNAGRHPISPLGLWRTIDGRGMTYYGPLATTVGRFLSSGMQSILALGVTDADDDSGLEYRLWLAEWDAEGSQLSLTQSQPLRREVAPIPASSDELAAYLVSGKLVRDGLDDCLLLSADPSNEQVTLWRIAVPFPLGTDGLTFMSGVPGRLSATSRPTLIDLDADGRSDLAFMLTINGIETPYLVWNNPSLGASSSVLDLAQAIELPVPSARGMAAHRDSRKQTLLVASDSGVYELTGDAFRTITSSRAALADNSATPLPGGEAIAIGDMTGDGLADLAVSHVGRVRLYKQKPRLP